MDENIKLNTISVIIPMYNAEKTIIRALNSIVEQTYKSELEIIVVNDGSKDNSKQLVEDFISLNKELDIKLIDQQNGGVSKARNTGLKNAKGNYIALLDSDDAWLKNKLEVQMDLFLTKNTIDLLGTSFKGFYPVGKKKNDLVKIEFRDLLFKNYFQPSTIIFKREIIDIVGFFEETQRYAEEGNYFMRIARNFNCYFLNNELILFGEEEKLGYGESGLSANLKEMERGELRNFKFVYKQGWINPFTYLVIICFSIFKYIRRVIIVKLR